MKTCKGCKHALWERTAAGKLHPSGKGTCQYPWKLPQIPVAFYWITRPTPYGGHIDRKRDNAEHCAYWQAASDNPASDA